VPVPSLVLRRRVPALVYHHFTIFLSLRSRFRVALLTSFVGRAPSSFSHFPFAWSWMYVLVLQAPSAHFVLWGRVRVALLISERRPFSVVCTRLAFNSGGIWHCLPRLVCERIPRTWSMVLCAITIPPYCLPSYFLPRQTLVPSRSPWPRVSLCSGPRTISFS
jgi:hypothetical protein